VTGNDLGPFEEHVRALEGITLQTGGRMSIGQWPGVPDEGCIIGDRTGLMRLGVAILRYAIDAHLEKGNFKAEARVLSNFFPSPTETRTLFLQLNETPLNRLRNTGRGPSLFTLLGWLLPWRWRKSGR
jgi:hypothetical protein